MLVENASAEVSELLAAHGLLAALCIALDTLYVRSTQLPRVREWFANEGAAQLLAALRSLQQTNHTGLHKVFELHRCRQSGHEMKGDFLDQRRMLFNQG